MKVYVKPVGDQWLVCEMTTWESAWDDMRRFGLRVALHNLWWEFCHRHDVVVRTRGWVGQ